MERVFTVEEAQEVARRLRPLLTRLTQISLEAEDARPTGVPPGQGNGSAHAAQLSAARLAEAETLVAEISATGALLRDPHTGLVDFASERDGEPVYLCWQVDEAAVAHWHPIRGGRAGRQPL